MDLQTKYGTLGRTLKHRRAGSPSDKARKAVVKVEAEV